MLIEAKEIIVVLDDVVEVSFEVGQVYEGHIYPRVGGVPGLNLNMLCVLWARVWVDPLLNIPGKVFRNIRMALVWSWTGPYGVVEAHGCEVPGMEVGGGGGVGSSRRPSLRWLGKIIAWQV